MQPHGTNVHRQPAIALEGLSKRYGTRTAVDRLDLTVPAGSAVGFIGPNGAGKTTTMAMILGLVIPSAGTGTVLGQPLEEPGRYLSRVGALIEQPAFYPALTGAENLQLLALASRHDASQVRSLLERVGLADRGDDRYRSYSMGMKQRLGIAAALLGDPELLILDEPTNGLDPAGIHEMRTLVGSLTDGRRTVFVSSHALGEIRAVCDWLVIIDRGRGVFAGPIDDLVAGEDVTVFAEPEHASDVGRLQSALAAQGIVSRVVDDGEALAVRARLELGRPTAVAVNRTATDLGCVLASLRTETADIEAQFLAIVKGGNP